jgi:starch synthase
VPAWAGPAFARVGAHATIGRLHLVTVPLIERSHPYLRPDGTTWPDNDARFLAFSRAVAALAGTERPDVLHLHEWHTGTVLAALVDPPPSVVTLHDVADQGVADGTWLGRIGPRRRHYEWCGGTNPLAGAIALADRLVAVSPHYADEIRTPTGGAGLDGQLRQRGGALVGIRYGIDVERWDPAGDVHLVARFGAGDRALLAARARNRAAVSEQLGWPDDGIPLAAVVSRLSHRNGVDLLTPVIPVLRRVPLRLVVLGVGDAPIVAALGGLAADHPATFAFHRARRRGARPSPARRRRRVRDAESVRAVRAGPAAGDALRGGAGRDAGRWAPRHGAGRRRHT